MKEEYELNYLVKLTLEERCYLIRILTEFTNDELGKHLGEKLFTTKAHFPTQKKRNATKKATETRSRKAREKIQNAINLLHLEGKEITHNSIAITGGVSFNTVRKYIPDIDKIGDF